MDTLRLDDRSFFVDRARAGDVPALVALLGDDVLGREREGTDLESYARAFEQIDADPHHFLAAVRDESGQIVATLQLTLLPGLSRGGATRLQIEAVRIAASTRGSGLGTALFAWAHDWGRSQGAALAQLTTDASRTDAHRFYERLGYTPSHVGFKLPL
ncbi:MAG: GNAT family N-acetyltransferase [Brachybacterium sp.]|uniref:GNAT family N-acetyltransferase n=1 Tax=Brachybacterium sp. TaxID=1891286 RepID=UPI0026511A8E|nr:GNAT family N-acetyltransferase [Brachybacterium sp.]MDN6330763.1 GNAT family N-acetyltransferase [Brachybacterium sp.]